VAKVKTRWEKTPQIDDVSFFLLANDETILCLMSIYHLFSFL
jgi:hypothetical protein